MSTAAIQALQITKRFRDVIALDHVDLEIEKGEIHTILGENGAGKTTLMNILYGLYEPDGGQIWIEGKRVDIRSPQDALDHGIGMIHQHFMLIPPFTVAENVLLATRSKAFFLKKKDVEKRVIDLSRKYNLQVDPTAEVWQLSVGCQQRVEIVKTLMQGAKVLILDEPTAVLTPQEAESLFMILKSIADEGRSVIYISHKLREAMAVSDRITVLRRGKRVSTMVIDEANEAKLIRLIIGEDLPKKESVSATRGDTVLEIKNLSALNDRGLTAFREVSFSIHQGEILGIAGVDGNGQNELAEVIAGLRKATKGKILVNKHDMTNCSPRAILNQKVSYVPAERMTRGLATDFPIYENLILNLYFNPFFSKRGYLNFKAIHQHAERLISEYNIVCTGSNEKTKLLSGGNLQKLILARELSRKPDLTIAVQPTRGLDVKAASFVFSKLLERKREGAAILLISTELEEIMDLSDRVTVMYNGEIMGQYPVEKVDLTEIALLMAGSKKDAD